MPARCSRPSYYYLLASAVRTDILKFQFQFHSRDIMSDGNTDRLRRSVTDAPTLAHLNLTISLIRNMPRVSIFAPLVLLIHAATVAALPRVALYIGGGATGPSYVNYSIALTSLGVPFTEVNATDIDAGLSTSKFEVLLVPGGMSTTESVALGPLGLANVLQFVAGGGGYIGVCAGG